MFRFSKIKKEQDKYIKIINEVTDWIIQEREKAHMSDVSGKATFLDNLLLEKDENGKRVITNEEIRDEVNTLLFAVSKQTNHLFIKKIFQMSSFQGLDTTTVSLGFALSLLGIYTDIQVKMEKYEAVMSPSRSNRGRSVYNSY